MKQDEVLKGLGISLLGGYGIYWLYQQPCNISPVPGLPPELMQLMCFSIDAKFMIISIIASALLFNGVSRLVKNL